MKMAANIWKFRQADFGLRICATATDNFEVRDAALEQSSVGGSCQFCEFEIRNAKSAIHSLAPDRQRGASFRDAVRTDDEKDRWSFFDRALKAEPGGERDGMERLNRNVAQIDGNDTETVTLQQQIGDFKGLVYLVASHP